MSKVSGAGNSVTNSSVLNYSSSTSGIDTGDQTGRVSLKSLAAVPNNIENRQGNIGAGKSRTLQASQQNISAAELSGASVLNHLYGQKQPANNILDGFAGKLSLNEYQQISNLFISIAQDIGLQAYKRDALIAGDSIYVNIPATEEGGRMLVRALSRFDQVDDRTGGGGAYQQTIQPLLKAMGLDKSPGFMKGLASEAQALKLPWYMEALTVVNALLGMVPKGARGVNRGSIRNSSAGGRPISGGSPRNNTNPGVNSASGLKPARNDQRPVGGTSVPPGKLAIVPKPIQIYESNSKINIRLQGTAPVTEAAKTDAVQNLLSYYSGGSSVSNLATTVQSRLNRSTPARGENTNTLASFTRMTNSEKAALEYYTETGAFEVNGSIHSPRIFARQGSPYGQSDGTYIRAAGQYGHVLRQALNKAPQITGTFFRGANYTPSQIDKMKIGGVIEFPGFSSAAATESKAFPRNCVFRMFGKAADLRRLNSGEDEVVFNANSRFEVVAKRAGKDSRGRPATIVDLRQIK